MLLNCNISVHPPAEVAVKKRNKLFEFAVTGFLSLLSVMSNSNGVNAADNKSPKKSLPTVEERLATETLLAETLAADLVAQEHRFEGDVQRLQGQLKQTEEIRTKLELEIHKLKLELHQKEKIIQLSEQQKSEIKQQKMIMVSFIAGMWILRLLRITVSLRWMDILLLDCFLWAVLFPFYFFVGTARIFSVTKRVLDRLLDLCGPISLFVLLAITLSCSLS